MALQERREHPGEFTGALNVSVDGPNSSFWQLFHPRLLGAVHGRGKTSKKEKWKKEKKDL